MNGFLFPFFNALINVLYYTNLVELFKFSGKICARLSSEQPVSKERIIQFNNIAIDIFQVFKWGILIFFWMASCDTITAKLIIAYLIYSNLFVYFYYHVWGGKYNQRIDRETLNRKFLNYLLAIAFYLCCYAYLYQFHYSQIIKWPENEIDFLNAIYLSVANAFTLTYPGFEPLTQQARTLFMTELINTFLFFTIIMANSVPNHVNTREN